MKSFFLFTIFLLFIVSCEKANFCDCVKRTGNTDTLEIEFEQIDTVQIYKMFNVFLVQDTINKAVVIGGENLLNLVEVNQSDNFLTINDNNICNFTRSYENKLDIYLHLSNLEGIILYGPSKIFSVDTLYFEKLLVRVFDEIGDVDITIENQHFWLEYWFATGNANIKGSTDFFEILSHGYAYIHAFDFESKIVHVNQNSTGNAEVFPTEYIDVKINDTGNIYYKGNPSEVKILEDNSSGELIHLE